MFDFKTGEVLLIDKPLTWTSFNVVKKVRYLIEKGLKIKPIKVGHAGTLDPLATGLMIICTGAFTKKIDSYQAQTKEYIATIQLGATTPSFDLETQIDKAFPTEHITIELIEKTLEQFKGTIEQKPPVFSAKQIDGRRAYEFARKGQEVEMKTHIVRVDEVEILSDSSQLPQLRLRIVCSKGTYIRSLANDIGKALNSGGHLAGLIRSKIGDFSLNDALNVEQLEEMFRNIPNFKLESANKIVDLNTQS